MSLDRCSQMFNIIEWIGGSKRKWEIRIQNHMKYYYTVN
jgi:hypothetical protein